MVTFRLKPRDWAIVSDTYNELVTNLKINVQARCGGAHL